jgi:hypothetical protein
VGVVASLAMLIVRAPTLVPLENPVMRVFSGLTFYLLLPMAMIFIAWKAAPFSDRGTGLFCAAAGLFACHAMLMDRAPTVVPLKNPLMRILNGLTFHLVLPIAMIIIVSKAAVFLDLESGLLSVAVGGFAGRAISQLKASWRLNALLSVSAAIIALGPVKK